MHLIVTTPTGLTLIFNAVPTGRIDICAGGFTVASIEILIWGVCAKLTPRGPEELEGGYAANTIKRLWVRPDDLCHDGVPLKHEELIWAATTAREAAQQDAMHGVLGENRP